MKDSQELNPSQIGLITECKCIAYLLEQGFNVLIPQGNYTKYDLVIELNNNFIRIQCKHANLDEDSFTVRTWYGIRNSSEKQRYTKEDCDYFMTECLGKFYLFPIFGTTQTRFWFRKTLQKTGKQAEDYLAEKILSTLK